MGVQAHNHESQVPQATGQVENVIGTVKAVLEKAHEDGTDPYVALLEVRNTPIAGLNYSLAQIFLNRRLKTKLLTTAELLEAQIPTDARSQLLAQQQKQKFYFDRGAKSLPPLRKGDAVRVKTPNGWKPATVTKLANTPRSAIVTSDGTLYRRNRRDIIKTSQVGRDPCTQTPQGDKEACMKTPPGNRNASKTSNIVRTRSGRIVRSPRQKDFVYY